MNVMAFTQTTAGQFLAVVVILVDSVASTHSVVVGFDVWENCLAPTQLPTVLCVRVCV